MARYLAVLALALLAVISLAAAAPASDNGPIAASDAKAAPVAADAEPKEALKGAESAYYPYVAPYYAYSPYYAPYYPKYYGYPYVYPHIYG
ncbi:uncharacterized protein [Bemisia tabaci]|uniref:uncharacterized protein n=1 Tax=Bemisia tabaci TaxID=7038 RepID=UPI0008F9BFD9|nr:PREDICTED: RNA polymerase II degradation factor 1-like [Bemisia tabaci]